MATWSACESTEVHLIAKSQSSSATCAGFFSCYFVSSLVAEEHLLPHEHEMGKRSNLSDDWRAVGTMCLQESGTQARCPQTCPGL